MKNSKRLNFKTFKKNEFFNVLLQPKTLRKYQFHTLPMWDLQYKHKYLNYQYLHVGQFVFINFQATLFKSNE